MVRRFLPVVALVAVACGGSDGDGFVRRSLEQIPAALGADPDATVTVWTTDLERLASIRGLAAPDGDRTDEEITGWTGALTFPIAGGEPLIGYLPPLLDGPSWEDAGDIDVATGLELGAVTAITTAIAEREPFTVLRGDLNVSTALPEIADGVRTYGAGDDGEFDAIETSAWNQLGRPFRFATRDGAVAVSLSTPLATAWRAGVTESLADDRALGALAEALDRYGSISAYLVARAFDARPPVRASDAETDQFLALVPDVAPFSAVGLGVAVVDGEARAIVAYAFVDDGDAAAAREVLSGAWADGADGDGRPIGQQLAVLGSEVIGATVVIELVPVGGETTLAPVRMLLTDSPVFMHP